MIQYLYLALSGSLLLVVLFAASEAALAATNRVRLRNLLQAQAGSDFAAAPGGSSELDDEAQRFIATVTIAANIPVVASAVLSLLLVSRLWPGSLLAPLVWAGTALFVVAFLQIAPRLMVSGPGALHRHWWMRPAQLLVAIWRPPVAALMWFGHFGLRLVGLLEAVPAAAPGDESEEQTDEIRDLVESAQVSGVLGEEGKELIESIFTFGDTRVREIMIPRMDIVACSADSDADILLQTLQDSGLSRVPLYQENVDHIVGVLHVKDVLSCLGRSEWSFSAHEVMRPALFVPDSGKIDDAFAVMRARRTHMAIVMDEYGGTAGLLTVEDVLEELVGEIADEHDHRSDDPLLIMDENTALVDAAMHCEDLSDQWGLALPTGEFESVGGFMIEQLGRVLVAGDRLELPGATLQVHSMRGRRPRKILIERKLEDSATNS